MHSSKLVHQNNYYFRILLQEKLIFFCIFERKDGTGLSTIASRDKARVTSVLFSCAPTRQNAGNPENKNSTVPPLIIQAY